MKSIAQFTEPANNILMGTFDSFSRFLKMGSVLKRCNAYKTKGTPVLDLFHQLFLLVFTHKTLFTAIQSGKITTASKDTFYRFLNSEHINWSRFTRMLAVRLIGVFSRLTGKDRVNVLIIDDTSYERSRAQKVELLSNIFDHCKHQHKRGFRLLTLGWSDGNSFLPVDSVLLASQKEGTRLQEAKGLDKRTAGYKRRQLSLGGAPAAAFEMVRTAQTVISNVSYVLFDSWFATPSALVKLKGELGLDAIAMVKKNLGCLRYRGTRLSPKEIYDMNRKRRGRSKYLLSIEAGIVSKDETQTLPVQLIYVRKRGNRKDWLVLLTTDMTLHEEEVIRLYGKRWDIEVFFKTCKSYLRLTQECRSLSYDAMTAWVAIVFTRAMMLTYLNRLEIDDRTDGELFEKLCDELEDISFLQSFLRLLGVLMDFVSERFHLNDKDLQDLSDAFIKALPTTLRQTLMRAA